VFGAPGTRFGRLGTLLPHAAASVPASPAGRCCRQGSAGRFGSPEPHYNDDPSTFGRIIALVRPRPMPPGRTIDNYPSGCLDVNERTGELFDRWPIGWPSEIVFYSEHGGPVLRDAVITALHRSDYGAFAHQLLQGPINLSKYAMRPLRHRLMLEIRYQIARDPQTQVHPF
jgi:hypothetical protein